MPSKYEIAAEETVPFARSMIARALVRKYKMKEVEVAERLGVAQAAISKYITESDSRLLTERAKNIESKIRSERAMIDAYIGKIAEGKREYVNTCICSICRAANDLDCAFSHAEQDMAGTERTGKI